MAFLWIGRLARHQPPGPRKDGLALPRICGLARDQPARPRQHCLSRQHRRSRRNFHGCENAVPVQLRLDQQRIGRQLAVQNGKRLVQVAVPFEAKCGATLCFDQIRSELQGSLEIAQGAVRRRRGQGLPDGGNRPGDGQGSVAAALRVRLPLEQLQTDLQGLRYSIRACTPHIGTQTSSGQFFQGGARLVVRRGQSDDAQVLADRLVDLAGAVQGTRELKCHGDGRRARGDNAAPDLHRFMVAPIAQEETAKAAQSPQASWPVGQRLAVASLGRHSVAQAIAKLAETNMPLGGEKPPVAARQGRGVVRQFAHLPASTLIPLPSSSRTMRHAHYRSIPRQL